MRAALHKQAESLGFLTANQWAALIVKTFAALPPERALLVLGKVKVLAKSGPRIAGL
jgi:hypothetical protein